MKKKKLKKKYKELQKQYDALFCDYIRLKSDDEIIKSMTDNQILNTKDTIQKVTMNLSKVLEQVRHSL